MSESRQIALVTQPQASSGLGGYLARALARRGYQVDVVDARSLFWPKVWPAIRAFHPDRNEWWKRRWEAGLYSAAAWDRNTRLNGRLLDRVFRPGGKILQVGKEYFPHPRYAQIEYYVFILYNMRLALADGVTPWVPPSEDRPAFLEREQALYRRARHIFVGGGYVKQSLVKDYGVAPDHVTVAGGGVDEFFLEHSPGEVPARLTKTCLFVGWDFGMKGGQTLVEAFQIARQTLPDLKLVVVGPEPSEVPAAEGIVAVGPVRERAELLPYYRQADLFVMPSLRDSFGFVFLEAMSQGVPCIGSNLNAMPEIIEHGQTGYVVPPRNPQALARAILDFYADPANRARMGAKAVARVRARFTWDHVARTLARVMFEENLQA